MPRFLVPLLMAVGLLAWSVAAPARPASAAPGGQPSSSGTASPADPFAPIVAPCTEPKP